MMTPSLLKKLQIDDINSVSDSVTHLETVIFTETRQAWLLPRICLQLRSDLLYLNITATSKVPLLFKTSF